MRHVLLSLGILLVLTVSSITAQVPRRSFLFKDARGELAQARAKGETDVLLVIASMPGRQGPPFEGAPTCSQRAGTLRQLIHDPCPREMRMRKA